MIAIIIGDGGGSGGGGGAAQYGVVFDGSNDYFTKASGMTGEASSADITLAWWFKTSSGGTLFQNGILSNATTGVSFSIAAGDFYYELRDSSGSTTVSGRSSGVNLADGAWHVIMFSRSAGSISLYIDGASATQVNSAAGGANIGLVTSGTIGLFANRIGGQLFNGETGPLEIVYGTALDFTSSTNRDKYLSGTTPADFTASGTSPIIRLTGDATAFATNGGSGGSFTLSGSLADGSLIEL